MQYLFPYGTLAKKCDEYEKINYMRFPSAF